MRGAHLSKGGRSIIAIASTAGGGKVSKIVPFLDIGAAVTTSRTDVDYIITEYGIAKLLSLIHISSMQMMAESLVLGEKAGLDWVSMVDCICDSAAASPIIKAKQEMFSKREFAPMCTGYTLEKDLGIALSLGQKHGITLPITGISKQNYSAMKSHQIADKDYAAILYVNEIMNGIDH